MVRRLAAGDPAEGGARHQAGAAGIVVEIQAADHLPRRVEAGDGALAGALDLGLGADLDAAEGEGDARGHGVGFEGRRVQGVGPVGFIDRQSLGAAAVMHVRVERDVGANRGVEVLHRLDEPVGVHALQLGRELLDGVGGDLGDSPDVILAAQQMRDLLVEDLPGEHARLLQDFAAVAGVAIAVEILALVAEPLAVGVHDDAERHVMLLELIADIQVAVGRRVQVPGHRMAAGPVPIGHGADIERHGEPFPVVVFGAAHLGEVPAGAEVAGAHLLVRFEPAAGQHHRLRVEIQYLALVAAAHAVHAAILVIQQVGRRRLVQHVDARLLRLVVQRLDQLLAAAVDAQRQPAPELELAVHLERLPPGRRDQVDAVRGHPFRGVETVGDQHLDQVRVGAVLGHAEDVVVILVVRVGAEVDIVEILVGEARAQFHQIVDTVVGESEGAAGEGRVAAARVLERGLQHQHRRAVLHRRQGRAGRRVSRADDDDVHFLSDDVRHGRYLAFGRGTWTVRTYQAIEPSYTNDP